MKWVYLSGGVGGARLLRGLSEVLGPEHLTVIVNTGDDFDHWGLRICPDLDTVMYNLAGLSHDERGWGLARESFEALEMVRRYGGATWFALGDRDLATHLMRTEALRGGESLTAVTRRLYRALGIGHQVLPMCDARVATTMHTEDGRALPFQRWFVQEQCAPALRGIRLEGHPEPHPEVLQALRAADAVVIGPSNPYVSIDPILQVPETRAAVFSRAVFAVSPIVAGQAVKGPLATMIEQLAGTKASAGAIARHYAGEGGQQLAGLVVERGDEAEAARLGQGVPIIGAATVMRSHQDSVSLARTCLEAFSKWGHA